MKETKPKGYWNSWENLENEIKAIIVDDVFPTLDMIKSNINKTTVRAIMKFGGMYKVAERMGYELTHVHRAKDGHYVNSVNELLFDNYLFTNKIPHEVNGFIDRNSSRCRFDFKIGHYYIEIWGYEVRPSNKVCTRYNIKRERKEKIYKELGVKLISIESHIFKLTIKEINDHFKQVIESLDMDFTSCPESITVMEQTAKHAYYWNEDKIIEELKIIVEKLGEMPTKKYLTENRNDLMCAICSHGGIRYFTELLGLECRYKPNGYWTEEVICAEINKLIEQNGKFPRFEEMEELDMFNLIRGINRTGGMEKYRAMLGYPPICKPDGFWTKETIAQALYDLKVQYGFIPGTRTMKEYDKTLASAISRVKISMTILREEVRLLEEKNKIEHPGFYNQEEIMERGWNYYLIAKFLHDEKVKLYKKELVDEAEKSDEFKQVVEKWRASVKYRTKLKSRS